MMSIRALGNLGVSGSDAKQAAHYYSERSADYYVKNASGENQDKEHDESQGEWLGRGADKLGLTEPPTRDQLQLSFAGHLGGRQVQNAGRENRQMGRDSVAVYVALGSLNLKPDLEGLMLGPALLEGAPSTLRCSPKNWRQ